MIGPCLRSVYGSFHEVSCLVASSRGLLGASAGVKVFSLAKVHVVRGDEEAELELLNMSQAGYKR